MYFTFQRKILYILVHYVYLIGVVIGYLGKLWFVILGYINKIDLTWL